MMAMMETRNFITPEGDLKPECVNDLLVEVVSGRLLFESSGCLYATRHPLPGEQDEARIIYAKAMHQARIAGVLTRDRLKEIAAERQLLDPLEQQEKGKLEDMVRRYTKARQMTKDPAQKITLDADIEKSRARLAEIESSEEELYAHSSEALAEHTRIDYFVCCCTMTGEMLNQRVWSSWQEYQNCTDSQLIRDCRAALMRILRGLPINIIRAIARTPEWRVRWKGAKETSTPVFEGPSTSWDKNKLHLVWWSDFYDSILQHPDCPPEQVIKDDAALQEWINAQVAKREQAKNKAGAGGQPVPTYRDGAGRRHKMHRIGTQHVPVNQPYRIRT